MTTGAWKGLCGKAPAHAAVVPPVTARPYRARTACRPKPFAHSLEVVDRKRVRQRLVDQLRHGFAGIGQGHREILYQRLLSELRCRKRELDGNFLSRARFGRITA